MSVARYSRGMSTIYRPSRGILIVFLAAGALMLGGCAVTREGKLRAKSDSIADELTAERQKVIDSSSTERPARLSHLNTLRTTLSAVNIGLGSTRYLPEADRDLAYDVLDEAYETIRWNIPLGPSDQLKQMPLQFQNGKLELGR